MGRVEGKIALVTGAGKVGGIGATTAELLAREGAAVAVADLDGAGAREVAERIIAAGGDALALEIDLADPEAVQRMVAETVTELGGLDVLHNNAVASALMDRDGVVGDARSGGASNWGSTSTFAPPRSPSSMRSRTSWRAEVAR